MKAAALGRSAPAPSLPEPYRALFDSVSDMVVLIAREADGGYRCLEANAAVARMEGIPLEAILGKRVDAIHPPETYARWKAIYDRALGMREPLDVDHEVPGPLGPRIRRTRFLALPPDAGGRELLLGVCQDLTDSLRAQREQQDFERYREAMNRLNALLDGDRPEEEMLRDCVAWVREAFGADRCLLSYPCDPEADTVTFPFYAERPGLGLPPVPRALPVSGEPVRAFLARFLEAQEPVDLGPDVPSAAGEAFLERHQVRSRLAIPIRPRTDRAWCLTLQQCGGERRWTVPEKRLFRDMSARIKSALDALLLTRTLRRNEAFSNLLTEMMPQLLWTTDAGGKADFVNRRMREFTGLDDLERIGRGEHMHPGDMAAERERIQQAVRDGALYEGEMRVRRRDGAYVWHLVRSAPLLDAQGRVERRVGTCTDITDSKRLLEALARSKGELEAIIGGVDEGISAQDASGRIIYANRKYAEISGFESPEALLAAPLPERAERYALFDEAGGQLTFDRLPGRRVLGGEPHASMVIRFLDRKLGSEKWIQAKSTAVRDAEGKVVMAINFSQDITEPRRGREELLRSREQLSTILAGIADAILAQTPDGTMVFANEAAARQLDLPSADALVAATNEAVAKRIPNTMEFFDEAGQPLPLERLPPRLARQGIETPPTLLRFRRSPQGRERWVISRAKPIFDREGRVTLAISMSQDVTELKEKEEAVRRLQKMDSLGKLAGGIAHDFNNLLVSINGYSDLGSRMTEGGDPVLHDYFEEIRQSGERAASLTRQLLAYSRKQIVQPRILHLNAVVADMQRLLVRLIGEDIQLRTELGEGLPAVKADLGQMEQVIMNLVLNARDAMPRGGVLTLGTGALRVSEGDRAAHPEAGLGLHAVLSVADTGTGIDPAIRDRIFEPFFTTKEPGKGTGLGLAGVYGIVEQWGGHIRLESALGSGSTFRILLPAHPGGPVEAPAPAPGEAAAGSGTVLLVEDSDSVLRFAVHVLEARGYRVRTARNGAEALAYAESGAPLDLVIADVVMPDARGPELVRRLRELRPSVKALLMSGYLEPEGAEPEEAGDVGILRKPFAPDALAAKAARLLRG